MRSNLTRIVAVLLLVALAISCNENDFIKPIPKKNWIDKVDVQKEAELKEALKAFGVQANPGARTVATKFGELDLGQAVKVYDSANNAIRYSLRLSARGLKVENLVITKRNGTTAAYILQLDADIDWVRSNPPNSLLTFTGTARQLDLDRNVHVEKSLMNGASGGGKNGKTQECCTWRTVRSTATGLESLEINCGGEVYHFFKTKECNGGGGGGSTGGNGGGSPYAGDSGWVDTGSGGDGSGSGGVYYGATEGDGDKVGFYMSEEDWNKMKRVPAVELLLAENPMKLLNIPCEEIPKWQAVLETVTPEVVKDKINQLESTNTDIFDDWAIQTLNGANGTIVNMDYFSVTVTSLPTNPNTGIPFSTPETFFKFIRKNLNSFVTGSTFSPYCELPSICTQETTLWNSANPTGAIVYIDIPVDDGSVVCIDSSPTHWTFQTLEDPSAGNHPVSGTRKFGIETNPGGGYNVFIRGVDRFDSNLMENSAYIRGGGNPFFGADALWQSFQSGLSSYVNTHGGSSSINPPVTFRPDWTEVDQVLNRERPLSDLGCN